MPKGCIVQGWRTEDNNGLFILSKDVLLCKRQCPWGKTYGSLKDGKKDGVEGVTYEKDYKGYNEMATFRVDVDLTIFEEGEEAACMWLDHDKALILN